MVKFADVTEQEPTEEEVREMVIDVVPSMIEHNFVSLPKFIAIAKNRYHVRFGMVYNHSMTRKFLSVAR